MFQNGNQDGSPDVEGRFVDHPEDLCLVARVSVKRDVDRLLGEGERRESKPRGPEALSRRAIGFAPGQVPQPAGGPLDELLEA